MFSFLLFVYRTAWQLCFSVRPIGRIILPGIFIATAHLLWSIVLQPFGAVSPEQTLPSFTLAESSTLIAAFIFAVLFSVVPRTLLIFSFWYSSIDKNQPGGISATKKLPQTILASRSLFLLEGFFFLSLTLTSIIITIPILFAESANPAAVPGVQLLAVIIFLLTAVILFSSKENAIYYSTLSRISIKSAIGQGYTLFTKTIFKTLFFHLSVFSLLFTIFTFAEKTAMLSMSFLKSFFGDRGSFLDQYIGWILSFVIITIALVFEQALRLSFFRAIATLPKEPTLIVEKEAVSEGIKEATVPTSTPAS